MIPNACSPTCASVCLQACGKPAWCAGAVPPFWNLMRRLLTVWLAWGLKWTTSVRGWWRDGGMRLRPLRSVATLWWTTWPWAAPP